MLVSIVIVSYDCKHALLECLGSLESERNTMPLEVIVIDNASADDTAQVVSSRFPWVRLVVNQENAGFAHAANQGMAFARGEFVLFLNPDTIVRPGTISAVQRELERHPDVGMLGCKLVRADGTFDHACKRGFPTVASALYYFMGLNRMFPRSRRFSHYTAGHLDVDETGTVDAVNGAFMLVRRQAAEEVGALDERYWLYAEDLDWCRRFWQQGWKILYWPEVEVTHLKGASAGDHRSLRLNYAFHRSIWLFYAKHHAPGRNALLSAVVWLGVWSKFGSSAVMNALRSRRSSRARRRASRPSATLGERRTD